MVNLMINDGELLGVMAQAPNPFGNQRVAMDINEIYSLSAEFTYLRWGRMYIRYPVHQICSIRRLELPGGSCSGFWSILEALDDIATDSRRWLISW